jgi:hypothetical protein
VSTLYQWAIDHGVGLAAIKDLEQRLGMTGGLEGASDRPAGSGSELLVQWDCRMEGARAGLRMWRNNVGALLDERGVPVRYGLANDTAALNKSIKSADLIGIRPVTITPAHVGRTLGQFVSRECKAPGWTYSGNPREVAQLKWAELIIGLGGDACFATGPGTFT